jgi:hypothetical protein
MPRAVTCVLDGEVIEIDRALELRGATRYESPEYRCVSCGERVHPHRTGNQGDAHFEHWVRNEGCDRSDPPR